MHKDAKGNLFVTCPNCKGIKKVRKQTKHWDNPQLRFRCTVADCGTTWKPTAEERDAIKQNYDNADSTSKRTRNTSKNNETNSEKLQKSKSIGEMIFGTGRLD